MAQIDLFPPPPPSTTEAIKPLNNTAIDPAVPCHAISLTQPWATLVARGEKLIETRSWNTGFRGQLMIHAAKSFPKPCRELCSELPFREALGNLTWRELPLGAFVAIATLHACYRFGDPFTSDLFAGHAHARSEEDFGDYSEGRFGFALRDIVALASPIPAKGALSIWRMTDEQRAAVARVTRS